MAQAESLACWQIVDLGLKLRVFKHGEVETFFPSLLPGGMFLTQSTS